MDGTLTVPVLDFDRIREEIGLDSGPILEAMHDMSPEDRARTEAVLRRHEDAAAAASTLQSGAAEVVAAVRNHGAAAALMTRNSLRSATLFCERHGIAFDLVWTREDGPMKPSPEPVFEICRRLGVAPADSWVIGDFRYDILSGSAAGAKTVLFLAPDQARPDWADEADIVIRCLPDLLTCLGIGPAVGRREPMDD